MKKLMLLIIVLALSIVFVGCANNELKLYEAFKKSEGINSAEGDALIKFNVEGKDFSPEIEGMAKQIISMINGLEMKIYQETEQNEEGTVVKAYGDVELSLGGLEIPMSLWIDLDLKEEAPSIVEIIKMPQMFMGFISPDAYSKEYLVYDFDNIDGIGMGNSDAKEMIKSSKELGDKIIGIYKDFRVELGAKEEIVRNKGKKTINGERLSVYELRLDDKSFKSLVKAIVNYGFENEDIIHIIAEFTDTVRSAMHISEIAENPIVEAGDGKQTEDIAIDLENYKAQIFMLLDMFDDIQVIGDKGIVLTYGINKDGYIVYEEGEYNLRIDLNAIFKKLKGEANDIKGLIDIGLNYNSKIRNINKGKKVILPNVNKDNAVYFSDIIKDQLSSIPLEQ